MYDLLKDWGIDKKVFSITLDNASANDCMQQFLKDQLKLHGNLVCDGEFFHIRCCAHILHLIVKEGLAVASGALHKIRESVKYVKGSDGRMKNFWDCVQQVGSIDVGAGLRLDVATRWNSTYLMLDSALKYRRAFSCFQLNDPHYKYCPSEEEWERAEKLWKFLEPFYDITTLMSGSKYLTSNLYFTQVWRIESLLNENMMSEDFVIREMCTKMKQKFDKYWREYSVVLALGAVLDPRMKFKFLRFCFNKLDPFTCEEKLAKIKRNLYKLFGEYNKSKGQQSSSSSSGVEFPQYNQRTFGGSKHRGSLGLDAATLNVSSTIALVSYCFIVFLFE